MGEVGCRLLERKDNFRSRLADLTFKLRKAKDGLEYYTEQKSGYVKNNLEEQNKYTTGLYSDPKNYQLLKEKANELLSKMPSCVSKEY